MSKVRFVKQLHLAVFFACWLLFPIRPAFGKPVQAVTSKAAASVSVLRFAVNTVKRTDPRLTGWKMEFTNTGFVARNVTLKMLIQEGWNLYGQGKLAGGPPWVSKDKFDVDAKVDPDDMGVFTSMNLQARRLSLQALLTKRFNVSVQAERRQVGIFKLRKVGQGRSISETKTPHTSATPGQDSLVSASRNGYIRGENFSMPQLAVLLQGLTDRIVIDETGLAGKYDFSLSWASDADISSATDGGSTPNADSAGGPSLMTAVKEDLGLKLEPAKILGDVLMIKTADLPDAN